MTEPVSDSHRPDELTRRDGLFASTEDCALGATAGADRPWHARGARKGISTMTERKSEGARGSSRRGRRLQAMSCGLVLLGFACRAAAQSGVPDLAGSWRNQADPATSPAWQFTTSNALQTLDVSWMGSAATGHPDLHGSFSGTLMQVGGANVYAGAFQITEDAVHVGGTMSVTIDSADQVEIDLQPDNGGAAQHYVFVRVAGATISGMVLNPDQSPAAAALVGLCNDTTCVPGSSTSSTGEYSLTDVPDGLWGQIGRAHV